MEELIKEIEDIAYSLPYRSQAGIESIASQLLDVVKQMREQIDNEARKEKYLD